MTHELLASDGGCRVLATLVYDTSAQPMPSGIRAVMQQRIRRMLFTAEDTELILQVSSSTAPEHLMIFGQVLDDGIPVEGASVQLTGPRRIDGATDEDGEFWMGDLPVGGYELVIGAAGRLVDVPPLHLA